MLIFAYIYAEIEKMRAQMMEEIKAQLLANQELMVQEEEEKDADAWAKQVSQRS